MDAHNGDNGLRPPDELRAAAKDRGRQLVRRHRTVVKLRVGLAAVVGVVVIAVVVAFGPGSSVPSHTGPPHRTTSPGPVTPPTVDAAALAGHGDLAFVSGGQLYVLDGTSGRLHQVTTGSGVPSVPSYSHDGRWLAFVRSTPTTGRNGTDGGNEVLWMAHGDGTDAHRVAGVPAAYPPPNSGAPVFSWSPTADELVVTTGPVAGAPEVPREIWIVPGSGAAHELLGPGTTAGVVWSPDGSQVAVLWSSSGVDSEVLEVLPPAGGTPTVWLPADPDATYYLAGWASRVGLLVWDDQGNGGPSVENDGLSLAVVGTPGGRLVPLATTPLFQPPDVVVGRSGAVALVANADASAGGGEGAKFVWFGKTVELCPPVTSTTPAPTTCPAVLDQALNQEPTVTLDPALSPVDGSLAFVQAPESTQGLPPEYTGSETWAQIEGWYAAHTLWVVPGGTGTPTEIPGTAGASDPVWSSKDDSVVYVADDALWVGAVNGGQPVKVASPVTPVGSSNGTYIFGYADWSEQFAWSDTDTAAGGTSGTQGHTDAATHNAATHSAALGAVLGGDGIGAARFGQSESDAVDNLEKTLGSPSTRSPTASDNCTIDAQLTWPTVTAYFDHGRFVGYSTGSLLGGPHNRAIPDATTAAGLRIGDTLATARNIYGTALTTGPAQGGNWVVATSQGRLAGLLTTEVNERPAPRIADITAGSVGCPAASP